MNGEGAKAGYLDVKNERLLADVGTSGLGRVTHGVVGTQVTISEDGAHPFGFKIGALASSTGNVTLTQATGAPPSAIIDVSSQPLHNEVISLTLNLPDGSTKEISLQAQTDASDDPFAFQIGASEADTANNLNTTIGEALAYLAQTELEAASSYAAAEMFFTADGETAQRISGPPYDTATALVNATDSDTVSWYKGDSTAEGARQTVQVKVDDATTISYGVRANEIGFTEMVRALAAFGSEDYDATDDNSIARYDASNLRMRDRLSEEKNYLQGSIELVTLELGLAQTAIDRAAERHAQYSVSLENLVDEVEGVSTEEVALKMLTIQTRLEASYQTTSMLSQLSLVNYL